LPKCFAFCYSLFERRNIFTGNSRPLTSIGLAGLLWVVTHGKTYEEAFQNAQEVLASLTESDEESLPSPKPLLQVA
jgi:putative effector of murein hydrolase